MRFKDRTKRRLGLVLYKHSLEQPLDHWIGFHGKILNRKHAFLPSNIGLSGEKMFPSSNSMTGKIEKSIRFRHVVAKISPVLHLFDSFCPSIISSIKIRYGC
jgi:hypothetical protein